MSITNRIDLERQLVLSETAVLLLVVTAGASSAAPQSGEAMQRGIAAASSLSVTPGLCGNGAPTAAEQLHELAFCGGSHGPVALLPAPRDRSNCQALPYEMEFRTRTGTSIL